MKCFAGVVSWLHSLGVRVRVVDVHDIFVVGNMSFLRSEGQL
jgi:hypothetical protein